MNEWVNTSPEFKGSRDASRDPVDWALSAHGGGLGTGVLYRGGRSSQRHANVSTLYVDFTCFSYLFFSERPGYPLSTSGTAHASDYAGHYSHCSHPQIFLLYFSFAKFEPKDGNCSYPLLHRHRHHHRFLQVSTRKADSNGKNVL